MATPAAWAGITTYYSTPTSTFSDQLIPDLQDLGCTWWRACYRWCNIEQSPGVYTWDNLDAAVAAANAAGINLVLPIMDPPAWDLTVACGSTPNIQPNVSNMGAFAHAVASRYNGAAGYGTIAAIEIGNESEAKCADPSAYVALVPTVAHSIRSGGFTGKIGAGGLVTRQTTIIRPWLEAFYAGGCGNLVDYISYHYYNCPVGPDGGNVFAPSFSIFYEFLAALSALYGYPLMDIWCTETGYPTSVTPNWPCIVDEAARQAFFQATMDDARRSHTVSHLFFYTLDLGNDGMSLTEGYGPSRIYTPSYTTVKNYIANNPVFGASV